MRLDSQPIDHVAELAWLEWDASQRDEALLIRAELEHRQQLELDGFPRIFNPSREASL
jgi:hypothetical protein